MLREVHIDNCNGSLFLSRMPGRRSPFDADSRSILDHEIDYVVSLAGLDEIRRKSPEYAEAVENESLPFRRLEFAVEDYGVPDDWEAYLRLAAEIAQDLQMGKRFLIHCGAGIGRTGTLAASVLVALGLSLEAALQQVAEAGSGPETMEQEELVDWIARQNN